MRPIRSITPSPKGGRSPRFEPTHDFIVRYRRFPSFDRLPSFIEPGNLLGVGFDPAEFRGHAPILEAAWRSVENRKLGCSPARHLILSRRSQPAAIEHQ
jgi:hypothetical protein